ncbi:MAG: hypothetical protein AABX88_00145 [Nanoarchaeota archaeon]
MQKNVCELITDCITLKTLNQIILSYPPTTAVLKEKYCTKSKDAFPSKDEKDKFGYENCPTYIALVVQNY